MTAVNAQAEERLIREAIARGDGAGVRIAVIDSGVDFTHPQLARLTRRDDVVVVEDQGMLRVRENTAGDCYGHGTAVAGIIHQVAPRAEIGSFRVLGTDFSAHSHAVRVAAFEAIERGYQILNVSIGCARTSQVLKYKDWVDRAYLREVHVVSACNNHNYRRVEWPGHFTSVNTVNFTVRQGGDGIYFQENSLVEFACGGVAVRVPWLGHGEKVQTGSSFSAPRVAGWIARLISCRPDLDVLEVKAALRDMARRAADPSAGNPNETLHE